MLCVMDVSCRRDVGLKKTGFKSFVPLTAVKAGEKRTEGKRAEANLASLI